MLNVKDPEIFARFGVCTLTIFTVWKCPENILSSPAIIYLISALRFHPISFFFQKSTHKIDHINVMFFRLSTYQISFYFYLLHMLFLWSWTIFFRSTFTAFLFLRALVVYSASRIDIFSRNLLSPFHPNYCSKGNILYVKHFRPFLFLSDFYLQFYVAAIRPYNFLMDEVFFCERGSEVDMRKT